jgi:hypothetical protein
MGRNGYGQGTDVVMVMGMGMVMVMEQCQIRVRAMPVQTTSIREGPQPGPVFMAAGVVGLAVLELRTVQQWVINASWSAS